MARKMEVLTGMERRNRVPEVVSMETPAARMAEERRRREIVIKDRPSISAAPDRPAMRRVSIPEALVSRLPTGASRDAARMVLHGLARTGNTILRAIDIPNRVFGNTRSLLQDIYEKSEENLARDAYEDRSGVPQFGETAVHLASAGVLGRALPAVFGANVGADTYETAKYAGASEGEALAKGIGHGVVDTAIWTLGQGLASKYLPKAWQWLGREITGAGRGAASSVTSDAVLNSLGADISGEEMAKRAAHAAWMVPLLGMLKMGGKRREEAMSLLRKARPDLAGAKADKVIETIEAEFSDPKSQKVALAWVARKGANLPDDTAQIKQALEVSSKVKGLDPMSRSPFEILSDPAYARYLPKPKPQDVKAFSNMKRYPMGVIGFDVSDDAAGRQATREMINAYMSPSSNPWCLATGKDAKKLGELGPYAEGYWRQHSAVPKQIFFQEVDGKLELTAFRATGPGGEGRQEYWDTSDAGYSGIPLKVKVPGDPLGRYQKMVFRPGGYNDAPNGTFIADNGQHYSVQMAESLERGTYDYPISEEDKASVLRGLTRLRESREKSGVPGTFEDVAPGKVFKGDPFRDGRSQTWAATDQSSLSAAKRQLDDYIRLSNEDPTDTTWRSEADAMRKVVDELRHSQQYVLIEDKERVTENGITKFRTTKYENPNDSDYEPPKPGEQPKAVEIEESELVSPEWMRARGYDPENEADVRRMQQELNIRAWGNGAEAAMAVIPTKRTFMQTQSGAPETVSYGPDGRSVVSIDFTKDGTPYRTEYFESGPKYADPSDLYGAVGVDDLPHASVYGRITVVHSGSRLIRNPGSASPEVLNEVKWDEGLGSFVRTSGNRRWRIGMIDSDPNGLSDFDVITIAESIADNTGIDSLRSPTHWPYREMVRERFPTVPTGIDPIDFYEQRIRETVPLKYQRKGVITEDRQPDGTWAPAVDRVANANTGETVELPQPPPPVRSSDTRMITDDEIEAARNRGYNELEASYIRHLQGLPEPPASLEPPASREVGTPTPPEPDPIDEGDVPFALKAGHTRRNVHAAEGGGDAGESKSSGVPSGHNPALDGYDGPRIVVNPSTFKNEKDALCVACNEAFRIVMEETGFEPVSEPTDAQREFFSDTAYADDELQLRRTIIARICTFDTSVKDPTDGQIQESVEFLHSVLEAGYPQNEWEQSLVQKLLDILSRVPTGRRGGTSRPEPGAGNKAARGDMAGGVASNVEREEKDDRTARGAVLEDPKYDAQGVSAGPQRDADVPPTVERRNEDNLRAGGAVLVDPRHDAEGAEFDAERRRERQGV